MPDAYIYQGAMYCEECGEKIKAELAVPAGADQDDENTYDSNDYPKGPYGKAEVVDRASTQREANYLANEYRLAYGREWTVWTGRRKEEPR